MKPGASEAKYDDEPGPYDFRVYSCGTKGGGFGSQLTSFLIAEFHDKFNFISMDAGTSYDCIRAGATKTNHQLRNVLDPDWPKNQKKVYEKEPWLLRNDVGYFRQQQVNGFLITHAHMDHLAGLVISSADEKVRKGGPHKPIIATSEVMKGVKKALDRPSWPNMIMLGMYDPYELNPEKGEQSMIDMGEGSGAFTKSRMKIQAYTLSHDNSLGDSPSTAFKVCNSAKQEQHKSCILFLGDTAPDTAEWINLKKYIVGQHFTSKAAKDFLGAGPGAELIKKVRDPEELKKLLPPLPIKDVDDSGLKDQCELGKYLTAQKGTAGEEEKKKITADLDKFGKNVQDMLDEFDKHKSKLVDKNKKDLLGKEFHPLKDLWTNVASEIAKGIIHTIFIECSYDDSRPEDLWFGHLIPKTLIEVLMDLDSKLPKKVGEEKVDFSVVVMHIKPTFNLGDKDKESKDSYNRIETELKEHLSQKEWSRLNIELVFPQQTDILFLKKGLHAKVERSKSSNNAHREMNNLLVSDFGDDGDGQVQYGNVNGHFMHHREPRYGPKWHDSYHHEVGHEGRYYLAQPVPSSHYQNHLDMNLILVTTILMFFCICVACASFLCGFSVRQVIRKLTKTKKYPIYQDETDHEHIV